MIFLNGSFFSTLAYTSQPYAEAMAIRPGVSYILCLSVCRSGHRDPKDNSLLGGGVPFPEHRLKRSLESVPLILGFYVFPSMMICSLPFSPTRFVRAPYSFSNILPVSSLFSSYMPPIRPLLCIQPNPSSVWSPPSSVPLSPSAGKIPTLWLRPTNVLFCFPDLASHMQVCTPLPRPVRLVELDLGVGGGAKEMAPSPGQVRAYNKVDARFPY